MADSKYLPWQDKNGDMLSDVCPEIEPAQDICLKCSPNPLATVPDWRRRSQKTPFLNEKLCKYQVTYRTVENDALSMDDYWEKYAGPWAQQFPQPWINPDKERQGAIKRILITTGKDSSQESIDIVKEEIEHTDYWLDPRPGSYLRLLYSVDFDVIDDLPDAAPEPEEPPAGEDRVVTYDVHDMLVNSIRVRKGLNLYGRYYKVYTAMDGGNLVFSDSGKLFDLTDYGDAGLFGNKSLLSQIMLELDSFLNVRGMNLPNTGPITFFKDKVKDIEFTFDPKYKLKKMKVWTVDCGEVPKRYGKADLEDLISRPAWSDRTAVAFFAQLDELEATLSARVEQPWLEVLKQYTYPQIHATLAAGHMDVDERRDVPGCIADALEGEMKELGQDIMDDVFSIGDAIAYAFHKNLCRHDLSEVTADDLDLGNPFGMATTDASKMGGGALMQAFKEIDPRDQVFAHFCIRLLTFTGIGEGCPPMGAAASPMQMMDNLWAFGFDRIKVCGLLDLLAAVMDCLLGGLTLDEALRKILQSALKAMGLDDFGELFVGLPPEKQAELDALVKKNLAKGNKPPGASGTVQTEVPAGTSDETAAIAEDTSEPFIGKVTVVKPWENPELIEQQKKLMRNNNGTMVPTKAPGFGDQPEASNRRTLAQKFAVADTAKAEGDLDPNVIMDAYIIALLEVFQDNLLMLVDKLNDFPGAQILSMIISTMECPRPPLFNPGIMDFVKSIGLPFCRGKHEITMPKLENPFAYIPKLKDILRLIFEILQRLIMQLILKIIISILVKICELIGSAICKALELTGDVMKSMPAVVTGRQKFHDVIRDSICGPDADDGMVNDTITELMADLGPGGTALSNPDRALAFAEDISAASTQLEIMNAVLGNPSDDFLNISNQIRENEYPDYGDALPNEASIASFFKNVGFLMPVQFRAELKDAVRSMKPEDDLPANPTLCATPEKIEEFKEMRCQLLEGRATPEQCEEMFDKWRGTLLDDLGDVADIMNKGIGPYVADQMPPIFSDPGCDNGMLPFEPEEQIATVTAVLNKDMEKLKVAFSSDMLENGPGKKRWGFINMVMSDTLGNPYTAHQRKTFAKKAFVDFYIDPGDVGGDAKDVLGAKIATLPAQKGAYPYYVAEYLKYQFENAAGSNYTGETGDSSITDLYSSMKFVSTNTYQGEKVYRRSFEKLNIKANNVDMTSVPNPGYNVDIIPDFEHDRMMFIKAPRKKHEDADIVLEYRDNAKGLRLGPNGDQSVWAVGYDIRCYFSDLISKPVPLVSAGVTFDEDGVKSFAVPEPVSPEPMANRPEDNIRIYISELFNLDSLVADDQEKLLQPDASADEKNPTKKDKPDEENGIISDRKYEYMAVDSGLDGIDLVDYPHLAESFERYVPNPPQVLALYDLLGESVDRTAIKDAYDSFMSAQFKKVAGEIASNEQAWLYGAVWDNLTFNHFQYVVPKSAASAVIGVAGSPMAEAKVDDYNRKGEKTGNTSPLSNSDAILGESLDQYNEGEDARVIYLDPAKYGGTYMNPPLYVKPIKGVGWSGIVDLLFPELAPCKPKLTDLVDFEQIQSKIDEMYPRLADDHRLKSDPDCVIEVPYNRILERSSRAGLMGIIMAAIKMFASVHFLKSLATFTTYAPKFPDNYSNVYAGYIIERMEESFKDAGHNFASPFKDTEFWYAFLEQAVQLYAYRIGPDGDIPEDEVPENVQAALNRLDNLQDGYDYPFREDLQHAKAIGEAGLLETLKSYRENKNLEAVYETSDDAKLILKELVVEQLRETGEKFINNLEPLGMRPIAYDLDYYYMTEFCAGSTLVLDGKIAEKSVGLPTIEDPDPANQGWEWPGPFYSNGNEFTTVDNDTYVGYYHVHIDPEDGGTIYMQGDHMARGDIKLQIDDEGTTSAAPIALEDIDATLLLRPFATKTIVGITGSNVEGGFQGIGDVPDYRDSVSTGPDTPFIIRKYISINGVRKSITDGVATVRSAGSGNIFDSYPGTMQLIYDEDENPVGIDGELGVRYGLQLEMDIGGSSRPITFVEIDALDVPVSAFAGIESDSKLLYCLINELKEDPKFKLVVEYIFSLKKVLGIMALYNDVGFLPSIGEYTVDNAALHGGKFSDRSNESAGPKPGMYAILDVNSTDGPEDEDGNPMPYVESAKLERGGKGWAAVSDREGKSPFFLQYDEWDRITLRRSVRIMKKMFRIYYRSRDWDAGEDENGAQQWLEQLRERFKVSPGARFLPWWKKNRIRSNPYNANGELCDKAD